ncbi:MAG: FapA family protein [Planctomycetota bacterium]|jgi:uncharacterized protein (DUF342 family)/CheY-like chemotaxis protein
MPEEQEKLSFCRAVERTQGRFVFHTDRKSIVVYMGCEKIEGTLTRGDVVEIIRDAEVKNDLEDELILDLVRMARDDKAIPLTLIATGTPPVKGHDSELQWFKQPIQTKLSRPIDGADDSVDHREKHNFDNISEGDLVAEFIPKDEGVPGIDVFGDMIKPPHVEDKAFLAGINVRFDEADNKFYSTHYGLARLVENKVVVDPVYVVQNSVDLSTGNVRFLGRAEIGQDVLEGFSVSADEGIQIRGLAEACTLKSKGNVVVGGGVKGKSKGFIQCGGSLTARFLDEVKVVCEGDVYVKNEIINCEIFSHGRVVLEKGSVVGGRVVALKGIHVNDAGSELGTGTVLIAGVDYEIVDRLLKVGPRLNHLGERRGKLFKALGADLERELKAAAPDDKRVDTIKERMEEARQVQAEMEEIEREYGSLASPYENLGRSQVVVCKDVYPGVNVLTGSAVRMVKEALRGPLTFVEDELQGKSEIVNRAEFTAPRQPSIDTPLPERPEMESKRVLLIDDEESIRDILRDIFGELGYECLEARSAEEATEFLNRREEISLIVSDIKMPGENGIAFASRVVKTRGYEETPIIIMSGHFSAEQLLKVEASFRFCTTLTKPFSLEQVRAGLEKLVPAQAKGPELGFDCSIDAGAHELTMSVVEASESTISSRRRFYHCLRLDRRIASLKQESVSEAFFAMENAKEAGESFRIPVVLEKNAEGESGALSVKGDEHSWDSIRELYERLVPNEVDGAGRLILVADDMVVMRKMITRELEKRNFAIHEAKDGQVAIDFLKRKVPNCCLLDVNMPRKSGLDVLTFMRKHDELKNVPVVLCTGLKEKEVLVAAIRMGVSSIIMKPFEPDDLLQKIDDACNSA